MAEPKIMATFRPQQWINDYATDTGNNVEFDATRAFLNQLWGRVGRFEFNNYDSDELAEELPERQAHDGPFEVDVDEQQIVDFFAHYGVENWGDVTYEQWQEICEQWRAANPAPPVLARQVEVILCWDDHTWTTECVAIAATTTEAALESAAREAYASLNVDPGPVFVGLYYGGGDDDE